MSTPPIPAAQYLRMSTERQEYSFDNQRAAISGYADRMGFAVTQTYEDAGKSGLVLKRRDGLRQLLNDVISGNAQFKAVLVYDVSRWGRFQDSDEAAHYEFLCKAAGVRIHYCAEQFANDNSIGSSMMKAVKRVMAGEYSRELSQKVHEGTKRVSQAGFRTGGPPGFGFRRLLVSPNREPKCLLSQHDKKALQSDRVVLVFGPDHEVRCVRDMFRMFTAEQKLPAEIAAELRRKAVPYPGLKRTAWYGAAVNRLLRNPKYCGCSVFGMYTARLHTLRATNPRSSWTVTANAWEPIIDRVTFDRAQERFETLAKPQTDAQLLADLRGLLEERGTLSSQLLSRSCRSPSLCSSEPYVRRFGSLSEAFARVGFIGPCLGKMKTRRAVRNLRDQILAELIAANPSSIAVVQPDCHFRPRLRVRGLLVSLYVCLAQEKHNRPKWRLVPVKRERECVALIARLNIGNTRVMDFHIVPDTTGQGTYLFDMDDPWLRRGQKLDEIKDFVSMIETVDASRRRL